jgi:hypothetical protein
MAILDLRPNCECCDKDLPPAAEAYICTYECTFCPDCTREKLAGVCPNCLGNLVVRPIRPLAGPVGGLGKHPASKERKTRSTPCVPNQLAATGPIQDEKCG